MADIKQVVLERDLNPYHSFFSSFFAGLAELGMINQGSINIVAKRAADYLYSYLEAKELLPDMSAVPGNTNTEVANNLILYVNKILSLVGEYEFKDVEDGKAVLLMTGSTCRILGVRWGGYGWLVALAIVLDPVSRCSRLYLPAAGLPEDEARAYVVREISPCLAI